MHVLSADQFDPNQLGELFEHADRMRSQVESSEHRRELAMRHIGIGLTNLFYEPSTRTSSSFLHGAGKMGMYIDPINHAATYSSAAKGESLEDTIKTHNRFVPGVIVLRHPEKGAAARAAAVSRVPIINAGDGKGEHPTQALLDTYTIQNRKGRLDNLRVVIGGDLMRGRTARSLAKMLSLYRGNSLNFVSTPDLRIGNDIKAHLDGAGTEYEETFEVEDAFKDADVVYWTRLQSERPRDEDEPALEQQLEEVRDKISPEPLDDDEPTLGFVIDQAVVDTMPHDTIIMHPLPRVGEITTEVDSDPRAVYFPQVGNGMYLRMALMDTIISNIT
jgi:aspartate carbamoyltransferase catalytic subunit